ncbi:Y4yA family PLP-dependent enzyme [Streptomyces sp. NPDC006923]|uniref:Y4yA family PLP-dependent enzyme n=1 Tax=Streptomyces sp. NPDC006923 TaxID=3155355 RepID=UPI0033F0408B
MKDNGFLHSLVGGLGSPLNVMLPEQIAENVEGFQSVFRNHRLGGEILFAHKANRSSSLVRRLAASGASIDIASLEELQHALASGFTSDRVGASGPKDPDFLWLGARTGVTFHIDGRAELELLASLVRAHRLPRARVVLRLAGFPSAGVRTLLRPSRFGTPVSEVAGLLDLVGRNMDAVELIGVGYHLDTISLTEKTVAFEGCLVVLDECRNRGMRPRFIDIGGGFGVSYLAQAQQWDSYTTELTRSVLGNRPPLTWQGHGYGLRNENGNLAGGLGLYPAYRATTGPAYLDELLSTPAPVLGRPLATLLLESLYDLCVEPGRALADQCGVTLARVLEVREPSDTGDGVGIVRLGMNAADCGLEDHGVLMDPVIVPRPGGRPPAEKPVGVHLFGNLCLESDLITKRVVFLPRLPVPGELLCFANTAGYCMDFSAHLAERRPQARKVAAHHDGMAWHWTLDDQYWPLATSGTER